MVPFGNRPYRGGEEGKAEAELTPSAQRNDQKGVGHVEEDTLQVEDPLVESEALLRGVGDHQGGKAAAVKGILSQKEPIGRSPVFAAFHDLDVIVFDGRKAERTQVGKRGQKRDHEEKKGEPSLLHEHPVHWFQ